MQSQQARQAAAPVFAGVMFASAALIFLLQPMFARLVTPLLGGSPSVWNTSMVFFQAALLVGYVYAHRLARIASLQTQLLIHAGVLAAAVVAILAGGHGLRISVTELLGAPNTVTPILWLLGVLSMSVGLPYAAISATAPLLQAWYARTGRDDAHDPYHLYAASNLGSLLGLAAYPVVVEPMLGVTAQATSWAFGFVLVGAAILGAGFVATRTDGGPPKAEETAAATTGDRLFWIAAAAAPSSLMLGVTNHISTDVASAPFLWVIPLALYLITFVIAFGKGAEMWRDPVALLHPISLAVLLVTFSDTGFVVNLAANLGCFFLSALVCHLALSERRPPVGQLTEFYMYVSIGGVLGGAATALLAPVLFNDVYEYPLALAAVALFLPRRDKPLPRLVAFGIAGIAAMIALSRLIWVDGAFWDSNALRHWGQGAPMSAHEWGEVATILILGALTIAAAGEELLARYASIGVAGVLGATALGGILIHDGPLLPINYAIAFGLFAFGVLVLLAQGRQIVREIVAIIGFCLAATVVVVYLYRKNAAPEALILIVIGVIAVAVLANRSRPILASLLVLSAFVAIYANTADRHVAFRGRSFFGVTRVVEYAEPDGQLRVMMHGTTIHGAQYADGPRSREPLTYYHPDTGIGQAVIAALGRHPAGHLGLIGLGSGSTSCLKRPQDQMTIFEIDPMVVRFSTKTGVFTFEPKCAPDAHIVLGDARLGIATVPDDSFDALVVDAFSSDAVPAHLLTKEAVGLYLRKMKPDGVVVLHLSNRNLDLVAEAARVAKAGGWGARWASIEGSDHADYYTSFATSVLIVTRTQAIADALPLGPGWCPVLDAAVQKGPDIEGCEPIDLSGRAWSDEYINLVRPLLANLG